MAGNLRRSWVIFAPLAVTVALVAALLGAFWAFFAAATPDGPPDVTAVARSGDVDGPDQASAGRIDKVLADVGTGAPWLVPLGDTVADKCLTGPSPEWHADWDPVQCKREVVRYFGFDGGFVDRTKDLAEVLRHAGWESFDAHKAVDAYAKRGGQKVDGSTRPFAATDLEPVLSRRSAVAMNSQELTVAWAEDPVAFSPRDELEDGHRPYEMDETFQPTTVYRTAQPLDIAALAKTAFKHHRYLLQLRVADLYFGTKPPPTSGR
jgi:hypothetical protein